MAKGDAKEWIRKRPSIFWWTLLNLLAAAFAVLSWTTCYYVFNFPEKDGNYRILRTVKRLPPVEEMSDETAPDGEALGPAELYATYLQPDAGTLNALNTQLKRNYISNFKWSDYHTYITGTYRVTVVRPLAVGDFFHPGFAVQAQAYMQPEDELLPAAPYPVIIELLLPTRQATPANPFETGDEIPLKKIPHRAALLHVSRTGSSSEPLIQLTAVPLSYDAYESGERGLDLAPPDPLSPEARFPVIDDSPPDAP